MARSQRGKTRWRPVTRWRDAVALGSVDACTDDLIRYVSDETDARSGQPRGIIHSADRAIRRGIIPPETCARVEVAFRWFNAHLAVPNRFSHFSQDRSRTNIAISWIKSSATVHLSRLADLADILRNHGIAVHELRTRRPGYVTYEDRYQIVAVPFTESAS